MSALLVSFWPYIAAAGAALLGLWKVYTMGKASQKAKQAEADAKAIDSAKKVQTEVDALKPDDARKELKSWDSSKP